MPWPNEWSATPSATALWSVVALLATVSALCRVAPSLQRRVAQWLVRCRLAWLQRRPRRVVITGLHNSGKSTLIACVQASLQHQHGAGRGRDRSGAAASALEHERPSSVLYSHGLELVAHLRFLDPPSRTGAPAATAAGVPDGPHTTSAAATQWDVREFDVDVPLRPGYQERARRWWHTLAHADAVVWLVDGADTDRLAESAFALAGVRTDWVAARAQRARDQWLWRVVRWLARWLVWLLFGIRRTDASAPRFGGAASAAAAADGGAEPLPPAAEWPPLQVLVNKIDRIHVTPAGTTTTTTTTTGTTGSSSSSSHSAGSGGVAMWRVTSPVDRVVPALDPVARDTLYSPLVSTVARALRLPLDADVRDRFVALTGADRSGVSGAGGSGGGSRKRLPASSSSSSDRSGRWWFPLPVELSAVVADFVCDAPGTGTILNSAPPPVSGVSPGSSGASATTADRGSLQWLGPVHITCCMAVPRAFAGAVGAAAAAAAADAAASFAPAATTSAAPSPYAPLVDWSWLRQRMGRRVVMAAARDLVDPDADADADTDAS